MFCDPCAGTEISLLFTSQRIAARISDVASVNVGGTIFISSGVLIYDTRERELCTPAEIIILLTLYKVSTHYDIIECKLSEYCKHHVACTIIKMLHLTILRLKDI